MPNTTFTPVATTAGFPFGTAKIVEAGGHTILLCNDNGTYYAISPLCSHAQEPLACGRIKYAMIACPAHGARFDLETGEAMNPPATAPIKTFAVRVVDGVIEVAA
jgi:3-phenylpropionate/trans-cinnamate dioxygenase ferredoxin component